MFSPVGEPRGFKAGEVCSGFVWDLFGRISRDVRRLWRLDLISSTRRALYISFPESTCRPIFLIPLLPSLISRGPLRYDPLLPLFPFSPFSLSLCEPLAHELTHYLSLLSSAFLLLTLSRLLFLTQWEHLLQI